MNTTRFTRLHHCCLTGVALAGALILNGCAHSRANGRGDLRTAVAELMQTEKDFCRMARERGVPEAFRTFAAEDGMLLPMGDNPVKGRSAIFTAMSEGTKCELEWSPEAADVARSSDFGYTWGKSVVRRTGEDGKPIVRHGKYLTVWKRQGDGSWRFVMDIGNPSPPP